jgi:long-chain acyl-CoA synthetase
MTISTLADIIRTHGAERPAAVALDVEGHGITFGELHHRSSQVANALAAVGVQKAHRVASIDKNSLEFFELTFGLAKIGAVNVAVNWRLAPAEMAQIIEDAQAEVVVVGPEFFDQVEKIEGELSRVHTIVAIGDHPRWISYEAFIEGQPIEDPDVACTGSDVCYQLYTSGTTGLPKGVMLTNDNFFTNIEGTARQWRFDAHSVNLAMMPTFHIAGAGWSMVGLYFGCRTVVLRDIDPAEILRLIPAMHITNAFMVPVVIQFLLLTPGVERTDFSSLRAIVYGASPITEAVLVEGMARFGCEFIQVYGLTETTGAITQLDGVDHDPEHRPELLRSAGRPYPWVEVRIVDGSTGDDVAPGAVGEIWIRSPQVMAGYWNNPEATAQAVTPDGWFKSGDAGFLDDGFLFLHDRVKDMIVSGGENVYPAEVENALMKHPGVADVAVIGVPDDKWGEAVKAIVVKAEGTDPTEADLITFAREHLAGYKLPKSVDFADTLPRNPSGKLLKRELREPFWAGRDRQIG